MKTTENNTIFNEFVPHEVALAMKELGFNEPCFAMWTNGLSEFEYGSMMSPRIFSSKFRLNDTQSCQSYSNNPDAPFGVAAPTFSQTFRWFREKYKLQCYPILDAEDIYWCLFSDTIGSGYLMINGDYGYDFENLLEFESYEEAELECLKKLIEIVKTK